MPEQRAQLNYLRITPRKVRLVAETLKGLSVNEAEAQLMHRPQRASRPLLKLLRSAVANARTNQKLNADHLYVQSIRVDQGPMLKRMLPRARGMATPIQKKMSHVTLVLGENQKLSPRFKIVVPKKVKLPPGEEKKARKPKREGAPEHAIPGSQAKRSGFFRRIFNRKATGGA